jgi:hypothetical protein
MGKARRPSGSQAERGGSPRTPEQRRAASLAALAERGVRAAPGQPLIESEEEAGERTQDELRGQIIAVTLEWMRAQFAARGMSHAEFLRRLSPLRDIAEVWLSDSQREFIDDPTPAQDAVDNAAWCVEALNALLWAAGLVGELRWPSERCDPAALEPLVERVLEGASLPLRSPAELLDQTDVHVLLLWGAVRGNLGDAADSSVVYERARALGWLTQPGTVGWDEVDMAT